MSYNKTLGYFAPLGGVIPSDDYTRIVRISNRKVLTFSDSIAQSITYVIPRFSELYQGGTLTLKIHGFMQSATSGSLILTGAVEAVAIGDTLNFVTTESFDTANSATVTVPGSTGEQFEVSITLTNNDSIAVVDTVRIQIARDTSGTSTGNFNFLGASLIETVTTLPLDVYDQVYFATGSASSPSIAHTGDTNCGIFFGTDEIHLATSGTDQAKFDSSGNLAIGSSTALGKLESRATSGAQIVSSYDASNYLTVTTGSAGSTTFALTGTTPFFTFGSGTDTPHVAGTIVVQNGANTNLCVRDSTNHVELQNYCGSTGAFIGTATTHSLQIRSDNVGAIYIDVNQKVGIGAASPSARLHSLSTTEQLRLGYDTSNYLSATVGSTGSTTFALTGTTPTFQFSQNVGIGTSPAGSLHVSNSSFNPVIIERTGSTFAQGLQFRSSGSGSPGVQSGDQLVRFAALGMINTGVYPSASSVQDAFTVYATENYTATAQGRDLRFFTVLNGGITPVQALTLANNGNANIFGALGLGIGTSTPLGQLESRATSGAQIIGSYDATHYLSITTGSTGSTTFALTGTSPTFTFSQNATFSGTIGVGTSATTSSAVILSISGSSTTYGVNAVTNLTATADTAVTGYGGIFVSYAKSNFNYTSGAGIIGVQGTAANFGVTSATITRAAGVEGVVQSISGSTGTITNGDCFYATSPSVVSGTITNAHGLFIAQQKVSGVTTGYGVYQSDSGDLNYFAGNVGIGVSPRTGLDVASLASTVNFTAGTDPSANMVVQNNDTTVSTGPAIAFSSYYTATNTIALATMGPVRLNGSGSGANAGDADFVINITKSVVLTERARLTYVGNFLLSSSTIPANATVNLCLGGGTTSPVLGSATTDIVSLAAVDKAAADRRLYIQSEAGSAISLGNDRLNFAATVGLVSIGGTDTVSINTTGIGIGGTPSYPFHVTTASDTNDASKNQIYINSGTDGTLGPLYLVLGTHPSATSTNRYDFIGSGDNIGMRALALNCNGSGSFGQVGVGTISPSARLHTLSTAEQLRVGYDASNYMSVTVASAGSTTFALTGTSPLFQFSQNVGIGVSPRQNLSVGSYLDLYAGNQNTPTVPSIRASSSNNLVLNGYSTGSIYLNYDAGTNIFSNAGAAVAAGGGSGSFVHGLGSVPGGSPTFNMVLAGPATSPVLGSATADMVSMAAVDKAAADRRLYIQSEAGSVISLGNDRLNFAATTGIVSIGGTDVLGIKATSLTVGHTGTALGTLESRATSGAQIVSSYDASNYMSVTVASAGSTTFALTGTTPYFHFSQSVAIGTTSAPNSRLTLVSSSQTPASQSNWLELTTGTGATTDNKLVFGVQDGTNCWIQAAHPGTGALPLLLNYNGGLVGNTTNANTDTFHGIDPTGFSWEVPSSSSGGFIAGFVNSASISSSDGVFISCTRADTTQFHILANGTHRLYMNGTNTSFNAAAFGSGATNNIVISGPSTSPVLGAALADSVSLAAVDASAGHRRLYLQSEAGSAISLGDDRLNFAASTGYISIGGTDVVTMTSTTIGLTTVTSGTWHGSPITSTYIQSSGQQILQGAWA
jgi:hypothetical protein